MGRRGPPQTPAKVLQLRGTYRKDRHAPQAPAASGEAGKPLTKLPNAPKGFDGVAKATWLRAGEDLIARQLLHPGMLDQLAGYCWAVSRAVALERRIVELGGPTYTTPTGFSRIRPDVSAMESAWVEARKFALQLGLSATAIARQPAAEAPPADPDEDFLFSQSG